MANILSAALALAGIVFGGDGDVTAGDFTATGLETPEKMPFGGSQRVAVHRLLGGSRVIDLLGPDEADISWSGYFSGPMAQRRAQMVDAMRQQGSAIPLTWPGDGRIVVITDFRCSYERGGFLLPYSITCMVVPGYQPDREPTLLQQLGSDISDSLGITDALDTLTPALQSAQSALNAVQAVLPVGAVLTSGSASFLAVQGAVAGASGIVGPALSAADGTMSGVLSAAVTVGNVIGGSDGASGISALATAQTAAQGLAGLTAVRGFIGRMTANLTNASS